MFAQRFGFFRHAQRRAGDLWLASFGSLAEPLDGVAIAIASRKIHPGINAGRIFAQLRIDQADGFKEILPVERREQTHAGDDVADRNLRRRLAAMLLVHGLFDRVALLAELFFQPAKNLHHRGVLLAQPLGELDHERPANRLSFSHPRRQKRQDFTGLSLREFEEFVGERVRLVTFGSRRNNSRSEAAKILNQRQPQGDGNGPQLANRKR